MNIKEIYNLLFSNNFVIKLFVPTKNKKLVNMRTLPTAKQNENFLGEVKIKGSKKKLKHKISEPILTKATKTLYFFQILLN